MVSNEQEVFSMIGEVLKVFVGFKIDLLHLITLHNEVSPLGHVLLGCVQEGVRSQLHLVGFQLLEVGDEGSFFLVDLYNTDN